MADQLDEASELETQLRDSAIASVSYKLMPQVHADFDGINCIDCGVELPALRLNMGRIRCVGCQNQIERMQGR